MLWTFLFLIEFVLLFFLSQELTKRLSSLLLKFTRNQKTTIYIMAAFFFPGVLVHELSHLIVANMLFVRTGEVEFFPQIEGDHVKLGSVAIAKTDPIRRFIIGIAPVVVGVIAMFALFFYLSPFFPGLNWQSITLIYSFFEIGNTMFSSKKDMEGTLGLFIALFVVAVFLFALGIRINPNFLNTLPTGVIFLIKKICLLLLLAIIINVAFITLTVLRHKR